MALTPRHTPTGDRPRASRRATPSAARTNEAIRAFVDAQAGQEWSSVESAAYEVLLIEWAAATRDVTGGIIEAA
ncbi:hypothetical protein ACFVWY_18105 [Streptomyces sp. NPDC058195]|uniref:hypothetical protein n=1 Tax=Streptomyces sp. NPDC058195 TaxID=3346375 RepID=UPI0036EB47CB